MKINTIIRLILVLIIGIMQDIEGSAQTIVPKAALHLQPYRLKGGHFFRKNICFADYKTHRFRRTFGSFFAASSIQPANLLRVEGIPLYHKKKRRSKDVFRFDLYKNGERISKAECKARLYTNETFHLLPMRQDSSFFGARNEDLLEARIELVNGPSQFWKVMATNLNGSKREEQKGVIRKDSTTIYFTCTFAVLKESTGNRFNSLYNVYAFRHQNEIVATVTVDERGRHKKIWLKETLNPTLETVIANTMAILTARRTIYK